MNTASVHCRSDAYVRFGNDKSHWCSTHKLVAHMLAHVSMREGVTHP